MEEHIILIVRFLTCILSLVGAIILMVRADDNQVLRIVAAFGASALIYFNEAIGRIFYLVLGSTIETLLALMGVGFVLLLGACMMALPVAMLVRYLVHG